MRGAALRCLLVALGLTLLIASSALAAAVKQSRFYTGGPSTIQQVQYPNGVERLHYRYGPIFVTPGSNLIVVGQKSLPKPNEDGYVVGLVPDLVYRNGKVPPTDVLHLHHGVWLNTGASDTTSNYVPYQRFFATGEEKTQLHLPAPYGYPVHASDTWLLNYMIHNLTTRSYTVYLSYEVDFVPQFSPLGQTLRPVRPIWMDVQNGQAYPVFNALKGTGTNGAYTYPDQDPNAYPGGAAPKNEWTVDRPGTLVWGAGHLHPGGLYDDLDLIRPGASVAAQPPGQPQPQSGAEPNSVRLLRSTAHYWDPRGPESWDLAMSATDPSWRVGVQPGDVLRVSTTYDTHSASWYEAMGIMVLWMADDDSGVNPFTTPLNTSGDITHGRLAENIDTGGAMSIGLPDPRKLPNGHAPHNTVDIKNFSYLDGGYGAPGKLADPPTVRAGKSLKFINEDNTQQIFHTITACRAPCMLNGGISYPLANGPIGFDSGQLGTGTPGFTAAANRITWKTPSNLPPGTYTYFCRVHPFMRGTFRVVRQ